MTKPSLNTMIMLGSAVAAVILWLVFRPRDRWFPWGNNKQIFWVFVAAICLGLILALIVRYYRTKN